MTTITDGTVTWRLEDIRTWGLTQRITTLEDRVVKISEADYEALGDSKLTDNKIYFIE